MKLLNTIRRSYSTHLPKNALTFSNRQTLTTTESSICEPTLYFNDDTAECHVSMYPYYVKNGILRQEDKELNDVVKRFDNVCYYTGPERELYSSFVLLNFYKILESPDKLTSANLKKASMLAWCYEMVGTAFLLEDDIMDNTEMRWKKKCYHRQKKIGLTALTDTKLLYMSAFKVLRKYFSDNPFYGQLINLLSETIFITSLGQSADVNTNLEFKKTKNLKTFSYKKYNSIAKCKTGFILYKGPPLAAMYLAQINNKKCLHYFSEVCDKFAIYRQAQDDVWDVYGDFNLYGKLGNDISNGKCTWLIVTAMHHASEHQLKLLQKHYGQENTDSQNIVRQVYKDIDVLSKFSEYKYKLIDELTKDITNISVKPLRELCYRHVEQYIDIDEQFLNYTEQNEIKEQSV
ncbi:hypothetical protein RN001_002110 [Aquatica leii]|uniref:Uncharacterized protein n=1 Tax=Aquatica leii TaxID=1421715 RepID=A0AAN7SLN6_9COLE|nr:hypothetical protein RN001_002110 [Aquatica leii]